jgi:Tol biopolymer transport system component
MRPRWRLTLLAYLTLVGSLLLGCGRPAVQPAGQADPLPATWPLTPPGCCPFSRWSADGTRVFFYYQPENETAGLWSVDLSGQMAFLQPRMGLLSANEQVLVSRIEGNHTLVERLDGGASLTLPNGGIETLPSPDGRLVAYFHRVRGGGRNSDSLEHLMVAPLDGGAPDSLVQLARSDYLRWFPDSRRLLVFGWQPDSTRPGLWVAEVDTGVVRQIMVANYLSMPSVSPDTQWIAYLAGLQPDPADSGVWVVRPDGSDRRRLPVERAVQWAPDSQAVLALMPTPGGKEIHRLDLATGSQTVLVSHGQLDFDVEADDWSVAPDGRHILYRSARDRALWVIQLAP